VWVISVSVTRVCHAAIPDSRWGARALFLKAGVHARKHLVCEGCSIILSNVNMSWSHTRTARNAYQLGLGCVNHYDHLTLHYRCHEQGEEAEAVSPSKAGGNASAPADETARLDEKAAANAEPERAEEEPVAAGEPAKVEPAKVEPAKVEPVSPPKGGSKKARKKAKAKAAAEARAVAEAAANATADAEANAEAERTVLKAAADAQAAVEVAAKADAEAVADAQAAATAEEETRRAADAKATAEAAAVKAEADAKAAADAAQEQRVQTEAVAAAQAEAAAEAAEKTRLQTEAAAAAVAEAEATAKAAAEAEVEAATKIAAKAAAEAAEKTRLQTEAAAAAQADALAAEEATEKGRLQTDAAAADAEAVEAESKSTVHDTSTGEVDTELDDNGDTGTKPDARAGERDDPVATDASEIATDNTPPPMRASKARKAHKQRKAASATASAVATPPSPVPKPENPTPPPAAVPDAVAPAAPPVASSGGWGGWGFSSVLSAVADGVTSVADHVVDALDDVDVAPTANKAAPTSEKAASLQEPSSGVESTAALDTVPTLASASDGTASPPVSAAAPSSGFSMSSMFSTMASAVDSVADTVVSTLDGDTGPDADDTAEKQSRERYKREAAPSLADVLREAKTKDAVMEESGRAEGDDGKDKESTDDLAIGDLFGVEKKVQTAVMSGLGTVGKSAFSLLKQHLPQSGPRPEADPDDRASAAPSSETPTVVAVTFAALFEEYGGQSRYEALQLLSGTAEARVTSLMGLRQGKHRAKMARFLQIVGETLQVRVLSQRSRQ
jgi:hypothetical protein